MGRKAINLIGQKFGRLTVLERDTTKRSNYAYWICRCNCGNIISVRRDSLINGRTQSCGCLQKEAHTVDLIGQKFGHLIVLKKDASKIGGSAYWICRCDCGNIISVRGNNLKTGNTTSCGCINSKGEHKIRKILNELEINFIQQKTFNNLKDKNNLRFDFFLPDYNCCIEYNGIQHYEAKDFFGGIQRFEEQKEKDNIKRQWCKNNNIKLIEIPYWDFDKINEDYLKSRL